jgi:hypothetical protein
MTVPGMVAGGATPVRRMQHCASPSGSRASRCGDNKRRRTTDPRTSTRRGVLAERGGSRPGIRPANVTRGRTRTRLRKTLVDERTTWRFQAILSTTARGVLEQPRRRRLRVPGAARVAGGGPRIEVPLAMVDALDPQPARAARGCQWSQ